jgi:hypothetical protein
MGLTPGGTQTGQRIGDEIGADVGHPAQQHQAELPPSQSPHAPSSASVQPGSSWSPIVAATPRRGRIRPRLGLLQAIILANLGAALLLYSGAVTLGLTTLIGLIML